MEGGRFVVEDLGSANGTHLNNTRVQKQALGHADIIQCGSLMIRFLDEGAVNVVPQQPHSRRWRAAAEEGRHDGARAQRRAAAARRDRRVVRSAGAIAGCR